MKFDQNSKNQTKDGRFTPGGTRAASNGVLDSVDKFSLSADSKIYT